MLVWILDTLFGLILGAMDSLVSSAMKEIGFNFDAFNKWFSIDFLNNAYEIICSFAYGLVFIIMIFQFLKTFGVPIGIEADSPLTTLCRGGVSLVLISISKDLFNLTFEIFTPVYNNIWGLNSATSENLFNIDLTGAALSTIFTGFETVQLIVFFVMMVVVFYNFIKYLIELVERYLLLCFIGFTAPLGISAFTSKSTSNIFQAWFRMAFSQYLIYLINILGLKMFLAMSINMNFTGATGIDIGEFIISCIALLAFIKLLQKLDMLLSRLGLEVGNAGGPLLEELMVGGKALSALTGKSIGGLTGGKGKTLGGDSGSGGIIGSFKDKFQNLASKTAASNNGKVNFGTMAKTLGSGMWQKSNIAGAINGVKNAKTNGTSPLKGAFKGMGSTSNLGRAINSMKTSVAAAKINSGFGEIQEHDQKNLSEMLEHSKGTKDGVSNFANGLQRDCTDEKICNSFFNEATKGMGHNVSSFLQEREAIVNGEPKMDGKIVSQKVGNGRAEYVKENKSKGTIETATIYTSPSAIANAKKDIQKNPTNKSWQTLPNGNGIIMFESKPMTPPRPNNNANPSPSQNDDVEKKNDLKFKRTKYIETSYNSLPQYEFLELMTRGGEFSMEDNKGGITSFKTYESGTYKGESGRVYELTLPNGDMYSTAKTRPPQFTGNFNYDERGLDGIRSQFNSYWGNYNSGASGSEEYTSFAISIGKGVAPNQKLFNSPRNGYSTPLTEQETNSFQQSYKYLPSGESFELLKRNESFSIEDDKGGITIFRTYQPDTYDGETGMVHEMTLPNGNMYSTAKTPPSGFSGNFIHEENGIEGIQATFDSYWDYYKKNIPQDGQYRKFNIFLNKQ